MFAASAASRSVWLSWGLFGSVSRHFSKASIASKGSFLICAWIFIALNEAVEKSDFLPPVLARAALRASWRPARNSGQLFKIVWRSWIV